MPLIFRRARFELAGKIEACEEVAGLVDHDLSVRLIPDMAYHFRIGIGWLMESESGCGLNSCPRSPLALRQPTGATGVPSLVYYRRNLTEGTDEVRKPNKRELAALLAIQGDDQGQGGELDIFDARECEAPGWVTKVDGAYRLTEAGKRVLDEMSPSKPPRD